MTDRWRVRPRRGEIPPPEPTRLECQTNMTLEQVLDDLPRECNVGAKKSSKGHKEWWIGYKLHIDSADGRIPSSRILTSAFLHDSQAASAEVKLTFHEYGLHLLPWRITGSRACPFFLLTRPRSRV